TVLADRAVTVCLWSGLAGWVVASALASGQRSGWVLPLWRIPGLLAGTWLAVLVVAALLGWIEDLGNARPLRLIPRRVPARRRRFRARIRATRIRGKLRAGAVADDEAVPAEAGS
ncbi:MAG TPA: hypothetical protein VFP72_12925, partial [Kineosporiaceae bacterium]|nr:hypothetical protein [Kineosporiaceae bacterium]